LQAGWFSASGKFLHVLPGAIQNIDNFLSTNDRGFLKGRFSEIVSHGRIGAQFNQEPDRIGTVLDCEIMKRGLTEAGAKI